MLVRKTIFGGLSVLGDIHAEFYDGQAHDIVASGRLQAGEDLYVTTTSQLVGDVTIGNPALGTTTLTVYGLISVPPGPGYTSGLVIERNATIDGTLDVSGTLDVTGEVTLSDDVTMGIGKTLKVDNIFKANAGLGLLTIEGIGVEGDFLYTDNIAEKTAANGIRIDLLKIKDNTIDLISGTEIIIEENVRIRDGKALEVSAIYEADLSSDINVYSQLICGSAFRAKYQATFDQLIATGIRPVYASSAGVLTDNAPDYNYDQAFNSNGNVIETPASDARLIVSEVIAAGASVVCTMYIDLTNIENFDENVIVRIYMKPYFSAGAGSATITVRDSSSATLVTHTESVGQAHYYAELMWRKNDNVWILLRDDTVAVVP